MTPDLAARRRAVDGKQAAVGRLLDDLRCEGALLLAPAHVAWFTGGLVPRGLFSDTERPGLYIAPAGRWLLCSNVDTQRCFDDHLDGLGFQLKEWPWLGRRAALVNELLSGKQVAVDGPDPTRPDLSERLRAELRPVIGPDRDALLRLGGVVAGALEAAARTLRPADPTYEVAGQVAHRLWHHGAEAAGVSVAAGGRAGRYRRDGSTAAAVGNGCVIQATGTRDGLYVTASRAVAFGPPSPEQAREIELACKLAAVYQSFGRPGETVAGAAEAGRAVTNGTPYEYDWRHSPAGHGTGWVAAEELCRSGVDDKLVVGQAVVWQARVGAAAAADTVLVGADGPVPVTPPGSWPYKRIRLQGKTYDIPDVLVREA